MVDDHSSTAPQNLLQGLVKLLDSLWQTLQVNVVSPSRIVKYEFCRCAPETLKRFLDRIPELLGYVWRKMDEPE